MLTDINFQEGEIQDFILEVPTGVLYAPLDIVFEGSGGQSFILETSLAGGNIFIMSE
jgi:hypothetical protein